MILMYMARLLAVVNGYFPITIFAAYQQVDDYEQRQEERPDDDEEEEEEETAEDMISRQRHQGHLFRLVWEVR